MIEKVASEFAEIKTTAIQLVQEQHPDVNKKSFRVLDIFEDFLQGTMIIVEFADEEWDPDAEPVLYENYVYLFGGNKAVVYLDIREMILGIVAHRESRWRAFVASILSATGMSGLLALIITCTVCYIFAINPETQIPQVLSFGWASVIAFYFGSKMGQDYLSAAKR